MALTRAQLSSAFTDYVSGQSQSQIARTTVLLGLISVNNSGAGNNLTWNVEGGANDSNVYSDAENIDADTAESDARVRGSLQWAIYGGPINVGDLAGSIAESLSPGHAPDALRGRLGLMLDELRIRNHKTSELLAEDLYVGTGTRGGKSSLVGLRAIAKNGDADVYAGLTPSTYTWWKGLKDATGGVVSKSKVQTFFKSWVKDGGCGRRPSIAVMDPDIWLKLKQSVETDVRTQVNVVTQVTLAGGTYALPGGATAYYVDGVLCVEDKQCPTGELYAWADGALELVQLPEADQAQPGVGLKTAAQALFGNVELDMKEFGDALKGGRLQSYVKFLAKTGLGTKAFAGVNVQLKCRQRNAVGVMTGLTTS